MSRDHVPRLPAEGSNLSIQSLLKLMPPFGAATVCAGESARYTDVMIVGGDRDAAKTAVAGLRPGQDWSRLRFGAVGPGFPPQQIGQARRQSAAAATGRIDLLGIPRMLPQLVRPGGHLDGGSGFNRHAGLTRLVLRE